MPYSQTKPPEQTDDLLPPDAAIKEVINSFPQYAAWLGRESLSMPRKTSDVIDIMLTLASLTVRAYNTGDEASQQNMEADLTLSLTLVKAVKEKHCKKTD